MFLPSFKARSQWATVSGLGGSEGTKHEERFKRIHEAMIDVQNICKEAIEEESYDTSEEGRDDLRGEGTPREDKLKGKLKH